MVPMKVEKERKSHSETSFGRTQVGTRNLCFPFRKMNRNGQSLWENVSLRGYELWVFVILGITRKGILKIILKKCAQVLM